MLFVPFIGLSVLIHIILIVIYKTFHLLPNRGRVVRHVDTKTFNFTINGRSIFRFSFTPIYWLGLIIITAMFGFVIVSSSILVRASTQDKHASLTLIKKHGPVITKLFQKNLRADAAEKSKQQ